MSLCRTRAQIAALPDVGGGFGFRLGGAELFQLGFQVAVGNVDRQHFQNIGATRATAFSSLISASGRYDSIARR